MWNDTPTKIPGMWQSMQWMWEDKPLQSSMQKYAKTETKTKVTSNKQGHPKKYKKKNPTHGTRETTAGIVT